MRSSGRRPRVTGGRSDVTPPRGGGTGGSSPDAMNAARPPGLSTAKHLWVTSAPTVSGTAFATADLREVLGIVVDDLIGAEAAHVVTVRCARRGDYASTNLLGELNGEAGDAARPTLDEDRFSAVQLQRLLDGAQRGEARKCQSCGVDMRQPVGFLGEDGRLDRNLLGIGALLARCANARE
jgi:hypothetical protein